ncbi:MAG: hypothetical protein ABGY13_04825 [Verrucomicrobiia bacterium]
MSSEQWEPRTGIQCLYEWFFLAYFSASAMLPRGAIPLGQALGD